MKKTDGYIKKIGVLTYWQYNYGSILQCFATCKVVRDLGYHPVVFSDIPDFFMRIKQKALIWSKILFYPKYRDIIHRLQEAPRKAVNSLDNKTIERMNKFVEQHIPVEKKKISQWKKEVKSDSYIAFLSGSDQVWDGYRCTSPDKYFLRFVPKYKRIAWAPSFGTSDVATYNIHVYRKYIEQFPFLSVREKEGVDLIQKLTGIKCQQLIDPVYLLTKEEWERLTFPNKNGAYILCYFLDTPDDVTIRKLEAFCVSHGKDPLIIGNGGSWVGKLKNGRMISCGPDEFVSLICHASYLFTDSFHGVSFSLILHTPFFVFHRNYTHGIDQGSRILSILQMCNFEKVYEPDYLKDVTWDFMYSDTVIQIKRNEMLEYLIKSINYAKRGERKCMNTNRN